MAHNIALDKTSGEHAFFSRKEPAWHGLGQVVSDAKTSEEVVRIAHLDYTVAKAEDFAFINGIYRRKPNSFSVYRTDTDEILSRSVSDDYTPVQNIEAFNFIDEIIGAGHMQFETAGALGVGERIFVTAKLPNSIRIKASDDIVEGYIVFTNGHDGRHAVQAMITPVRVVCNNTLNMSLHNCTNKVVFKHLANVTEKMKLGIHLMGLYRKHTENLTIALDRMADVRLEEREMKDILVKTFLGSKDIKIIQEKSHDWSSVDEVSTRSKNILDECLAWTESGVGQDVYRGSALWLYNGISGYLSNGKDYKDSQERFKNLTEGRSYDLSQRAFDLCLETAN